MKLKINGEYFEDEKGRSILLRGVNLGGSTKVPASPDGATHIKTDFCDHKEVSFIGRPFPLEEADEHYTRLKNWGFNCLRFLTTWEAIEHKGPGEYDRGYLEYLRKLLEKANDYELYCFIDPHQDVWSRMTGGDGAPGWTFETVGLDFSKLIETDSTLIMQKNYPDDYPKMIWSSNYNYFGTAAMFTLFFGGNDFAPGFKIGKKTIQDYLQEHYINSIKEVAKICKDLPNVIGYDIFNEPNPGFIGKKDLLKRPSLSFGLNYNILEAMANASGCTLEIPKYATKGMMVKKIGNVIVNPKGVSCWLPKSKPIWKELDVWELDKKGNPVVKQPDFFTKGKEVNFFWDYLKPFINKFSDEMQSIHQDAFIFVESDPHELILSAKTVATNMKNSWTDKDAKNIVNAAHWYDGMTLYLSTFFKHFNFDTQKLRPIFFYRNIKRVFKNQLKQIKSFSNTLGNCPTIIGETGIPFNMHNKRSYSTNNWTKQENALTLHMDCMDALLLNYTIWNYTADNCNKWGDLWNLEDLSIFSRDQQYNPEDINSGGRAIDGFCRPYARNVTGRIISMTFNRKNKHFKLEYQNNPEINFPTIIYVPTIQYPNDYLVTANDAKIIKNIDEQILEVYCKVDGINKIEIKEK